MTESTFPILQSAKEIESVVVNIENILNQLLFSQDLNQIKNYTKQIDELPIEIDTTSFSSLNINSIRDLASLAKNIAVAHQKDVEGDAVVADKMAAFQIMSQRFSALTGQQYADTLTNE